MIAWILVILLYLLGGLVAFSAHKGSYPHSSITMSIWVSIGWPPLAIAELLVILYLHTFERD